MKKEDFDKLPAERRKTLACIYLLKNKQERPEGNDRLFDKLEKCDNAIRSNMSIINEAQQAIDELNQKNMGIMGSIDTIVELISDGMTEEQIEMFCMKYEPPTRVTAPRVNPNIDIAGSTAPKNTLPFDKKGNQ